MSSLGDVMTGLKEVIVLVDKLSAVERRLDGLEQKLGETSERLVRVEVVMDFLKPAITRRLNGPGRT